MLVDGSLFMYLIANHTHDLARPSLVTRPEAEDVSASRLLDTDTLVRGLVAHGASDAQREWLQQPLPARNHWPGLPSDGHSPGVRPVACDSPAPIPLPGPHPAHAREQGGATRPASPHGGRRRLPRGQPVYGLPDHRHGPTCRTGTAARCLEHHGQAATTTITLPLYHWTPWV